MAGLSPLIWMTGGVSSVDDAAAPLGVEFARLDPLPAGDGFARPAEADWLNTAANCALVTHTGLGSLARSPTQSCWFAVILSDAELSAKPATVFSIDVISEESAWMAETMGEMRSM